MKSFALCTIGAFLLWAMAAGAQTTSQPGSAGSRGSMGNTQQQTSPGMGQQQPGMGQQPGETPDTTQQQTGTSNTETSNHEKTLKGCVESSNGQYELQTKKGKEVALTGQDVSAHVGHEVKVKGTWESGASAGMSQAGTQASAGKTFNVSNVKMVSESCGGKNHQGANTSPTGTGYGSGNGTGTGTGTGNGASTTPPQ